MSVLTSPAGTHVRVSPAGAMASPPTGGHADTVVPERPRVDINPETETVCSVGRRLSAVCVEGRVRESESSGCELSAIERKISSLTLIFFI